MEPGLWTVILLDLMDISVCGRVESSLSKRYIDKQQLRGFISSYKQKMNKKLLNKVTSEI